MAIDITPEMLRKIREQVEDRMSKDKTILRLKGLFDSGKGTYEEANAFAIRAGEILSDAYKMNISEIELPHGRLWYNIADRVLRPTLEKNYKDIAAICEQAQESVNKEIRIGLRVIKPSLNESRIRNLIQKISDYEHFSEGEWLLGEPIVNIAQSIVDDSIKANMEFQGKSGIKAKIKRRVAGNCCKWCAQLAGNYTYPGVPADVFKRHENCRCTIDYTPSKK